MKKLIFLLLLSISFLYANYNYAQTSNGKIDMHGGKKDKLIDSSKSFSNSSFKGLGTISKPIKPIAPKQLIKKEEKDKKKEKIK